MPKFQDVRKRRERKKRIKSKYIFSKEELKAYLEKNKDTEWLIRKGYVEIFLGYLEEEEEKDGEKASGALPPSAGRKCGVSASTSNVGVKAPQTTQRKGGGGAATIAATPANTVAKAR